MAPSHKALTLLQPPKINPRRDEYEAIPKTNQNFRLKALEPSDRDTYTHTPSCSLVSWWKTCHDLQLRKGPVNYYFKKSVGGDSQARYWRPVVPEISGIEYASSVFGAWVSR